MSDSTLFATIAFAHLLAVISPGPDFAMVTRQTLAHGRGAGLWTAWGIATGIIFHVAYGLFGLGWLLLQLPQLLEVLRYGGASFLIYMGLKAAGWRALRSAAGKTAEPLPAPTSARRDYLVGLITNLFNPKATLFFVALFSAAITAQTPLGLRLGLGLWIVLSTGIWFSFVAVSLGMPHVRARLLSHARLIDRAMGLILIALGLGMLLSRLI